MISTDIETRILVIKHGALGDIVQAFDAFAGLRLGYPNAHIAIMTSPTYASLFERMPWFDEVLNDPRASFLNLVSSLRVRKHIGRNWTFILDLQTSNRTGWYFKLFVRGNKRWIGRAPECSDPLPYFGEVTNTERMRRVVSFAGGSRANAELDWLFEKADLENMRKSDLLNGKFCILVPGCSIRRVGKRWSPFNYSSLANELLTAGFKVYLVGTHEDADAIDLVHEHAPKTINLCSKTNLGELTLLFQNATAVVGNDTGTMFLAAKCPTISITLMGTESDPTFVAAEGPKAKFLKKQNINDISVTDVLKLIIPG